MFNDGLGSIKINGLLYEELEDICNLLEYIKEENYSKEIEEKFNFSNYQLQVRQLDNEKYTPFLIDNKNNILSLDTNNKLVLNQLDI